MYKNIAFVSFYNSSKMNMYCLTVIVPLLCFVHSLFYVYRLVLEFDLLFYAFGKAGTVTWAWTVMFVYSLLVPYQFLVFWGSSYHHFPSKLALSLGTALVLFALQSCVLGLFPVYVVVHNQLPPASRFIVILEQVCEHWQTYFTDKQKWMIQRGRLFRVWEQLQQRPCLLMFLIDNNACLT